MPSDASHSSARYGLLLGVVLVAALSFGDAVLRASVGDSEAVCISLTVIGPDGGDPGVGCTGPIVAEPGSSSSSSSSSEESSSASSFSSAQSSASQSGEGATSGGRRYSVERSRWRIVRLLQQWADRNTMHAAPGSSSSSSSMSVGNWYDEAVRLLQERGYVDHAADLRLNDDATRAEVAKIITSYSGLHEAVPETLSFDDAIVGRWYVPFIERAALHSWMLGYDNCFGTRPCYFRPGAIITRAETAAVFVRLFSLHANDAAPAFRDVPPYAWYRETIRTAADHCILRGNDGFVRPDDPVTRAELFVMFMRAMNPQAYGAGCDGASSSIDQSTHQASVSASDDLCTASAVMCIYDALRTDIDTLFSNPFGASLSDHNVRAFMNMPASEWVMWLVFAMVPIGGILLASRAEKLSRKQPK